MQNDAAQPEIETERQALDAKLRILLPPEYQARYEEVQPVSMGSARLKFDSAGRVLWDEIWASFCDLAMAGGPPHKGKLLQAPSPAEIAADPSRQAAVANEICRGIRMVTDLAVEPSPTPGWVRVMCARPVMAAWLARAIAMENVSVHLAGSDFELPAGPHFRVEKEIKNAVTATAKTHHYFDGHMDRAQQRQIEELFAQDPRPLLQPCRQSAPEALESSRQSAAAAIQAATGLPEAGIAYPGWLGLECPSVPAAIWLMRALVTGNMLARREDHVLYVPIHPTLDPHGHRLAATLAPLHRLATHRGLFAPQS